MSLKREVEAYLSNLRVAHQTELDGPCTKNDWLSDEAMRFEGRIKAAEHILNLIEIEEAKQ